MRKLKQSQRPVVLAVNGRAEAVVRNAAEAIRQGAEDVRRGRHRPAREALDEFRRKHGIPG